MTNTTDTADGAEKPARFEIDFLEFYDEDSIIAELKRLATVLGKPNVSAIDLNKRGRVKYHMVVNHFGSLRRALEMAGLKPSRYTKASDEELLRIMLDLWAITYRESDRRPRTGDLAKYGFTVCAATIIDRFGSWKRALIAATKMAPGEAAPERRGAPARRPIPLAKRFMVIKRDLYRCQICNRAGVELEVDHIVPLNRGGSDRMDNLQTACRDCNRGKRDRLQ